MKYGPTGEAITRYSARAAGRESEWQGQVALGADLTRFATMTVAEQSNLLAEADRLRDELRGLGVEPVDRADGASVVREVVPD